MKLGILLAAALCASCASYKLTTPDGTSVKVAK